jgi:DNA-binding transcriptional LysR family regulator
MVFLDWWQSFAAVYRTGTVTAAARARHLTQPAVTQHISALEAEIGEALFTRMPRRMVPTERAKALYARVVEPLDRLNDLTAELGSGRALPETPIRLGAPVEYFADVVLDRMRAERFPVWVRFGLAQDLLDDLAKGHLDAVVATQRGNAGGIDYAPVQAESFVLITGAGQPAAPRDPAKAEAWLLEQPWLAYGNELPIIRRYWQVNFGKRPPMQPVAVIPNLHALLRAVELGYGMTVINDFVCADALARKRIRLAHRSIKPVTNTIWLACRHGDAHRTELTRLRQALTRT